MLLPREGLSGVNSSGGERAHVILQSRADPSQSSFKNRRGGAALYGTASRWLATESRLGLRSEVGQGARRLVAALAVDLAAFAMDGEELDSWSLKP